MKTFFVLMVILVGSFCYAQEEISTDRPDQTEGVSIVSKHHFQIEAGFTFQQTNELTQLLRFGLFKNTEIRVETPFLLDNGIALLPVSFSLKQKIIDQKKYLPATSVLGIAEFKSLADGAFQEGGADYYLKFLFENELNDKFSLGYNLGTQNFEYLLVTTALGYDISDKFGAFAEYFTTPQEELTHNFDMGLTYVFFDNLQLDCAYGRAFEVNENEFMTIGVSYLFRK